MPVSVFAASDAPGNQLFIVHYTTGAGWLPDTPFSRQPHAREHGENLRRMREAGILLLGARYAEKGMVILEVPSEDEARAQIERDPAVAAAVFDYEISAFRPFYDGCVERRTSEDKR